MCLLLPGQFQFCTDSSRSPWVHHDACQIVPHLLHFQPYIRIVVIFKRIIRRMEAAVVLLLLLLVMMTTSATPGR